MRHPDHSHFLAFCQVPSFLKYPLLSDASVLSRSNLTEYLSPLKLSILDFVPTGQQLAPIYLWPGLIGIPIIKGTSPFIPILCPQKAAMLPASGRSLAIDRALARPGYWSVVSSSSPAGGGRFF
jgi:hypothetical protein